MPRSSAPSYRLLVNMMPASPSSKELFAQRQHGNYILPKSATVRGQQHNEKLVSDWKRQEANAIRMVEEAQNPQQKAMAENDRTYRDVEFHFHPKYNVAYVTKKIWDTNMWVQLTDSVGNASVMPSLRLCSEIAEDLVQEWSNRVLRATADSHWGIFALPADDTEEIPDALFEENLAAQENFCRMLVDEATQFAESGEFRNINRGTHSVAALWLGWDESTMPWLKAQYAVPYNKLDQKVREGKTEDLMAAVATAVAQQGEILKAITSGSNRSAKQ